MKTNKTVLILGGSGFIGKNLVENFKRKYKVLSPHHEELDLLNQYSVDRYFSNHKIDVVINCVVVGGSREEEYEKDDLNNNLRIFFNILNNKDTYDKLIHLGSGAEYDKSRPLKKIREEEFGKRIPRDNYGLFKYTCSKIIENQENIVNLRLFGLFGRYEDYRYRFISNAICHAMLNLPIIIKQDVFFDYMYIKDFIKIADYFINHKAKHKAYNIGSGEEISILRIAEIIAEISDNGSRINLKKKGFNNEYTCDNSRLLSELPASFKFIGMKPSIEELYNWYKLNKKKVDISKL